MNKNTNKLVIIKHVHLRTVGRFNKGNTLRLNVIASNVSFSGNFNFTRFNVNGKNALEIAVILYIV